MYRLLFVCLFFCTVTDFSAKDKASGVKFCMAVHERMVPGRESPIFVNFAPQKPKIGRRISQRAHWTTNRTGRSLALPASLRCLKSERRCSVYSTVEMRWRKRHARDAPFMEYRSSCVDQGQSPVTYLFCNFYYFALGWGAKYCNQRDCVSVCTCLFARISQNQHAKLHVTCGRGLIRVCLKIEIHKMYEIHMPKHRNPQHIGLHEIHEVHKLLW